MGLNLPLAVNNDVEVTGQSYEYTVKNQFIEVTNKWDAKGTYFYYHSLPSGVTQVSFLGKNREPISFTYLLADSKLYHTQDRRDLLGTLLLGRAVS